MSARKSLVAAFILVCLGVGGWLLLGVGGWLWLRRPVATLLESGAAVVEQWCGGQLLAIANDHLGPDLSFDQLEYQYPKTVLLSGVHLTTGGVCFIEAASVRVEFAEVPKVGSPIVIESVQFNRPVVRLIQQTDGSLLGFGGFLTAGGGEVRPDGGSTRASDVLAIKKVLIREGAVHYETPDAPPMRLGPLTFDLNREPAGGVGGWYAFDAALALSSVANLDLDARINIDTAELEVIDAALDMALAPPQYELLPPRLQTLLNSHEIVGDMSVRMAGSIPLRDAMASALDFTVRLSSASVAFGEFVLPVRSMDVTGRLSAGVLEIELAHIEALDGIVELSARQQLGHPGSFELRGEGNGLRIENALRDRGDAEPKYAGGVDFSGHASGSLGDLEQTLDGAGELRVTDGRLMNVLLISDLLGKLDRLPGGKGGSDRGSTSFEFVGDHLRLTDLDVVSGAVAIHGDGEVFYDGRLNLRLNAGPLERLEDALGGAGNLLAALGDRLVVYQVTGTFREPVVTVRPFGVGVKKTEPGEGR